MFYSVAIINERVNVSDVTVCAFGRVLLTWVVVYASPLRYLVTCLVLLT